MEPSTNQSTHLSFQLYPEYLRVKLSGEFPARIDVFEAIRDQAQERGRSRIFVDLLEVDIPPSNLDRFWAGKTLADVFQHRFKIVALARQDEINRTGENAAVNRGARFLVTADEEEALRWLLD